MPNFEKFAWLFMRFSGVVLVFLAIGHLFIMLMWDNGVYRLDFNFVAQRWASPFWQTWDLLLLWLASPPKGIDVSGLAIVAALSRAWGSSPTSSGKTVWAIIGPENQL